MTTFAELNRGIARQWRAEVELPGTWKRSTSQAGGLLEVDSRGEAGGFFVELACVGGRRAYLKPLKRHGWYRAAREKIASDLAFEVGVSVPPVLLVVNDRVPDAERHACVSLLLYPHQFSWGQVKNFLAEGESSVASELSSMVTGPAARAFAFDTWVEQTDHNDHPSNIVFGYEGSRYQTGEFVFLDYAFSMGVGGSWKDNGFLTRGAAPFPARMRDNLDTRMLERTIAAIEGVGRAVVEDVVNRIPFQWLPDDEKDTIRTGLLARQTMVREALADYTGGRS